MNHKERLLIEETRQLIHPLSTHASKNETLKQLTQVAKQLDMTVNVADHLTAGNGIAIHYGLNRLNEQGDPVYIEDKKERYEQTLFISKEDPVNAMIKAVAQGIVQREAYQQNKTYSTQEKQIQVATQAYFLAYQANQNDITSYSSDLMRQIETLSDEQWMKTLNEAKEMYTAIENHPTLEKTLEHIQVKTTFKGHDFLYDIHIHPEHQSVSGTYQRDQASKHPATTSACLSALRFVVEHHDLNQAEVQYLNQVITQGEAQLHQESAQETQPSKAQSIEKNTAHTWKEQLEYARSANIIEVAQSAGLQLMREGNNQYRDVNNHSMVFTPLKNSYYENNGQFGGDPIHFVQHVVGIQDFKDAVQYLNDQQYGQVDLEAIQRKVPYQYDASKESKDFSKAHQYLVQERGIDDKLVHQLHQMGLIRQDKRNNVLFLWDENGKAVGCTEQGTVRMKEPVNGRDHWKGIQRNSTSNHGFNFCTGEPKHLKFFEAPIDALSYASLKGLEPNTQYVAMDGLKENTVIQYLQKAMEKTGDHIESIQLCVDHDEAGDKFIQKFNQIKQCNSEGQDVFIKIEGNQPQKPKNIDKWDWNNALIQQRCQEKKQTIRQERELAR